MVTILQGKFLAYSFFSSMFLSTVLLIDSSAGWASWAITVLSAESSLGRELQMERAKQSVW